MYMLQQMAASKQQASPQAGESDTDDDDDDDTASPFAFLPPESESESESESASDRPPMERIHVPTSARAQAIQTTAVVRRRFGGGVGCMCMCTCMCMCMCMCICGDDTTDDNRGVHTTLVATKNEALAPCVTRRLVLMRACVPKFHRASSRANHPSATDRLGIRLDLEGRISLLLLLLLLLHLSSLLSVTFSLSRFLPQCQEFSSQIFSLPIPSSSNLWSRLNKKLPMPLPLERQKQEPLMGRSLLP
mmetsp:Transcript_23357/g.55039  ORF Transcript_23357/g.55039 Transcript_23357/m.55039 type:complete len:247 (+) Transcript_23357:855-1595(+)